MNKLIYFIAILALNWQTSTAWSQDKDVPFDKKIFTDDKSGFNEAVKQIKLGDGLFYDGQDEYIAHANMHFLKAQAFNPYSSVLNYKIGVCYLYGSEKAKSLKHLQFVQKVNPDLEKELPFYLAQAYQLNNEFDSAIVYYQQYKNIASSGDVEQQAYINKKIRESRKGIELMADPVLVWIENLGDSINTEYPEYAPVISADNKVILFTARRPDSKGGKTDRLDRYYEDVYYSERESEGDWSQAKNIGEPINTSTHDATVGLAPDGKSVLTYQGVNSKDGNVLITKQNPDGTWQTPKTLSDKINTKHHESSATLSFDEKTMIFVSDKPGGYGQHDIYITKWNDADSTWGDPTNIGGTINTRFEEKGVFLMANGTTLYFSSDGHDNIGGLDIFRTDLNPETNEWSKPENVGYPINTPDDDIYFVVTGNGRYGYYSSSRFGGYGEKDIYKITFLGEKKKPTMLNPVNDYSAIPSAGAYYLVDLHDDGKPKNNIETPGKNLANLSGTVRDSDTKNGINSKVTARNTNKKEALKFVETSSSGQYKFDLKPGDTYELVASAPGYISQTKTVKMLSEGITKFDFNLAPVVVSETEPIEKTVEDKTENTNITAPVDKNDTDTKTEKSELTKTEPVEKDNKVADKVEDKVQDKVENKVEDKVKTGDVVRNNDNVKSSFDIKDIYFEFDKSNVNHIALGVNGQKELNELAAHLKSNPSLKVKLTGHTDQRGSASYNKTLSSNRANSAKKYLIQKGISASRIETDGQGETQPKIELSEIQQMSTNREKETAYQRNRRTEITLF